MNLKKICLTTLVAGAIGVGSYFVTQARNTYVEKGNVALETVVKEDNLGSYELVAQYSFHPEAKEVEHELNKSRFEKARKAYAKLDDINGATYDKETGWPILFAEIIDKKSNLPLMNLDNLVTAIEIVENYDNPGVSIEPPGMGMGNIVYNSIPIHQNVKYIPERIKNTYLGMRLFEADKMLKDLGFGEESVNIQGFETLPELARESKNLGVGYFGRIWFKPKEVSLKIDGNTVLFDQIIMGVKSESPYPAPSKFASHLEENYHKFASEKPIYEELLRITKEVAIARWLVENRYVDNLSDYEVQSVPTPKETNTLKGVVRETRTGMYIQQEVLIGGVILDVRNSYESSESVYIGNVSLGNLKNSILDARPEKTAITWDFSITNKMYRAVALPF